ncbi:LysE family translocator [Poseidonibacter antarcticus]|uniref:LysE family translocator n=1 Tax=Poseidonibacter antarcticus TaxID=2478538 RepID=UPI000EF4F365|nr:LysE family translocator [Poseidonibacter antarcticus]
MNFHLYLAYLSISFFTIVSPGAAILLAINNGLYYDLKAVLISSVANIIGLFILSVIAMIGISSILLISHNFLIGLKIIGAIYLIYLGIKQIINKNTKIFLKKNHTHSEYNKIHIFRKGFFIAITNPKPILFFSAIFPLFLDKTKDINLQFFLMTFSFMFISLCSLMTYGFLSKTAKAWFLEEKSLKLFYKISGFLFILMGIGMLYL